MPLTTTIFGLKKPDAASGDTRDDLYDAVRDNADILEASLNMMPFRVGVRDTNQSIPTGAGPTTVTYNSGTSSVVTPDFTLPLGTGIVAITVSGLYLVTAYVALPSLSDLQIIWNTGGSDVIAGRSQPASGAASTCATTMLNAGPGNSIRLAVAHSNGASQNLSATRFGVAKLSRA